MAFDDTGNLLTQTDPSGTITYNWDARNRLTVMTGPSLNASFAYDGLGRRARKMLNSLLRQFQYDGLDVVKETGGAGDASYLRTLAIDEAITRTDSADTVHYLGGALKSTLAVTNAEGASTTTYTYEPYGRTIVEGSSPNPVQYTGRENDGTGVYYYRARYYMPRLHRFMSEDPIRPEPENVNPYMDSVGKPPGTNLYQYVGNNPLNSIDPLGLVEWPLDAPSPESLLDLVKDASQLPRACSDRDEQCRQEFFKCLGLEVLAPGWSTVAMGAGEAAGPYFGARAYQHAAARNLRVPMRSSIVRRNLSISRKASPATTLVTIILAEGICLAREIRCLEGR